VRVDVGRGGIGGTFEEGKVLVLENGFGVGEMGVAGTTSTVVGTNEFWDVRGDPYGVPVGVSVGEPATAPALTAFAGVAFLTLTRI
jgi:hypothetical protein